jgi:uncharacterized protein YjbI with pentapeptide repeats
MSQGFTSAPLSNISNVTNLQEELDSKANLSGATFTGVIDGSNASITSISATTLYAPTISGTSITATNFYGNGSNLAGVPTVFTGITTINFGALLSGEDSYATTAVTDSNITANSFLIFNFSASTNHVDDEDILLDGINVYASEINPSVGFNLNATAMNDTWGAYTVLYKIIN